MNVVTYPVRIFNIKRKSIVWVRAFSTAIKINKKFAVFMICAKIFFACENTGVFGKSD